jgi:hypothetical protein
MSTFAPDEHRAIEAISALLDLFPREAEEDDEMLAQRMATWGIQQGPNVRWGAILYATRAMITRLPYRHHFGDLALVGMEALQRFNARMRRSNPGSV